jgi:DNA topoisomerase-3
LIGVLRRHNGGTVDVSHPARTRRWRSKIGRKSRAGGHAADTSDEATPKVRRGRRAKYASYRRAGESRQNGRPKPQQQPVSGGPTPPSSKMIAFAKRLAKDKRATLPSGYDNDFEICRRFLDQHAGR